jgi:anti-anti-sigma factor
LQDSTTTNAHDDRAAIELERDPAAPPGMAAIVRLRGGHDIATSRTLREALNSVAGSVLLDLSECQFIDSSVIYVIFSDAHSRAKNGQQLEVLVPPENRAITRTLEIARAEDVLTVHRAVPPRE